MARPVENVAAGDAQRRDGGVPVFVPQYLPGSGNEKCSTRGGANRVRAAFEARSVGDVE